MVSEKPRPDTDTSEFILSVASRLFAEKGFSCVSIRDICEEANVTPPTIYYYFGNKDQLFQSVIRKTLNLEEFYLSLSQTIEKIPNPIHKLIAFIQHYLKNFPRDFFNPGMFIQSSTQLNELSTERVLNQFQKTNELAKKIIQDGIQTGDFNELAADEVSEYLMNLLMAYVLGEVHYYQAHNPDEAAPFIAEMFLNGLLSRAPSIK